MKTNLSLQVLSWLKPIAIGIVIAFVLRMFFFSSYYVEGSSMKPTLQDGNLLVINKIGLQFSEIKRFDVIVFHANEEEDYVKRVIGIPGDRLSYQNNQLYVNDLLVKETFFNGSNSTFEGDRLIEDFDLLEKTGVETVPEGHLFVIGDNRLGSYDSRQFGFIKIDQVVGKVNLRYYPFHLLDFSF